MPGRGFRRGLATALAIGWLTPAAWGANLKDVRVGVYADHTRVVLETDAKTSYTLNEGDGVVTLSLQASGRPQAVAAKGPHLAWVRVEPVGSATTVKLELRGAAKVKQMVLTGPPRIVLDVFDAPGGAPPAVAKAPEPKPAPKPEPAKPAPAPVAIDDEQALLAEADRVLGPAKTAQPAKATEPDEIAATEGAPESEASASGAEAAAPAEPAPALAETESPAAPAPAPAPVRVAHKKDGGVLEMLTQPLVLGFFAIAALALFFILRRRRPARPELAPESDDTASLFGQREEAPAESTEPLAAGEPAEAEAAEAAPPPAADASGFSFEEPMDDEPERPGSTIGAALASAGIPLESSPAANGSAVESLADRLAHFEAQIEELTRSKERLERQVAAQTEELRVQRAAIARTQRVLRTVVRPDEESSEPVPKP